MPEQSGQCARGTASPVLEVRHLIQEFVVADHGGLRGGRLRAVDDVSFELRERETLGLVGETGSGKSTLARSLLHVPPPKSGDVVLDGTSLSIQKRRSLVRLRQAMQIVFQDPVASLDPQWRVTKIVEEPLLSLPYRTRRARRERVAELLTLVGLDPHAHGSRRPRDLSGGQCQRVAIARAIAARPRLIICDEAVASLDVIIQAQVLRLLDTLKAEFGLSYLFISHDLALVRQISDRIMVMYLGRLCEVGPANGLYFKPQHPYTRALVGSVPVPEPDAKVKRRVALIPGEVPSPLDPPSGCRFRTRCSQAVEVCARESPELREIGADHFVACHFPGGVYRG